MQVSIIIVNYNVRYFLEQCLHSVREATKGVEAEVFVVDNASTDGSRAWLEPLFPEVRFIWNPANLGFAKANNQALALAKGVHVLFLNPDTILPEDGVVRCLEFLAAHPKAGALGVRMLDGTGRYLPESKRAFPSPMTSLYKLSGLSSSSPGRRSLRVIIWATWIPRRTMRWMCWQGRSCSCGMKCWRGRAVSTNGSSCTART